MTAFELEAWLWAAFQRPARLPAALSRREFIALAVPCGRCWSASLRLCRGSRGVIWHPHPERVARAVRRGLL